MVEEEVVAEVVIKLGTMVYVVIAMVTMAFTVLVKDLWEAEAQIREDG